MVVYLLSSQGEEADMAKPITKTTLFIWLIILLILVGCISSSPSENDIQTAIANTQQANQSSGESILPTDAQESLAQPSDTPKSTNSPVSPPTEIPNVDTSQIIAKNFLASQNNGGVIVDIVRLVLGNRDAMEEYSGINFAQYPNFDNSNVIVETTFRVTNTTENKIMVDVIVDGTQVVNGEQVNFMDFFLSTFGFFNMGIEIQPKSTVIGGIWTSLESTPFDEINKVTIGVGGPVELPKLTSLGGDYNFEIEVENWTYEPSLDFDSLPIPEAIPTQNSLTPESTFTLKEINGNVWDLKVSNIEITNSIKFGTSEDLTETAYGRFAVIFMDVTNRGLSPESFSATFTLQIKDASDKKYGENVHASSNAKYNNDAYCLHINPDQTHNCVFVFDISPQSEHYILVPGDMADKNNPGLLLNIPSSSEPVVEDYSFIHILNEFESSYFCQTYGCIHVGSPQFSDERVNNMYIVDNLSLIHI